MTVSAQRRKMRNQRKVATVPIYIVFFLKKISLLLSAFIKQNSLLIENLTFLRIGKTELAPLGAVFTCDELD